MTGKTFLGNVSVLGIAISLWSLVFIRTQEPKGQKDSKSKIDLVYIDTNEHLTGRFGSRQESGMLDYDGAAEVALAAMNELGVSRILIMPPLQPPGLKHGYTIEDFIETLEKHPGRFAFLGGGGLLNIMIQQAFRDGATSPKLRSRFEARLRRLFLRVLFGSVK